MKKYFVIGVIILMIAYGFFILYKNKKTGYSTYGKSCTGDSDCRCVGIAGTADICGKPGQYPACVNGKCGFNNYK